MQSTWAATSSAPAKMGVNTLIPMPGWTGSIPGPGSGPQAQAQAAQKSGARQGRHSHPPLKIPRADVGPSVPTPTRRARRGTQKWIRLPAHGADPVGAGVKGPPLATSADERGASSSSLSSPSSTDTEYERYIAARTAARAAHPAPHQAPQASQPVSQLAVDGVGSSLGKGPSSAPSQELPQAGSRALHGGAANTKAAEPPMVAPSHKPGAAVATAVGNSRRLGSSAVAWPAGSVVEGCAALGICSRTAEWRVRRRKDVTKSYPISCGAVMALLVPVVVVCVCWPFA
jgi:hypothetical protein